MKLKVGQEVPISAARKVLTSADFDRLTDYDKYEGWGARGMVGFRKLKPRRILLAYPIATYPWARVMFVSKKERTDKVKSEAAKFVTLVVVEVISNTSTPKGDTWVVVTDGDSKWRIGISDCAPVVGS